MKKRFPINPPDKTIVEVSVGVFYQYDSSLKTWIRTDGLQLTTDVATELQDGLMSKEDYQKLNSLLLPPPHTTLTAESCDLVFNEGTIGFRSSAEHLTINYELPIYETGIDGKKTKTNRTWQIHENTYGIDFRLNLPLVVQALEESGKLTYKKSIGPQGDQGPKGKAGIDFLMTGPRGPQGEDGANAPFPGDLLIDPLQSEMTDSSRCIVDLDIEEVSEDENYIVATRAHIGNLDFCPDRVRPKNFNTKWIVALDEIATEKRFVTECCNENGCNFSSTEQVTITRSFCATSLYYLDITPIEEQIKNRFVEILNNVKTAKETLVKSWLNTMIGVFNEQKLAICCALENCQSRRENQQIRNFIASQQIQAAMVGQGHALTVGGCDPASRNNINTNSVGCPGAGTSTGTPEVIDGTTPPKTGPASGKDCVTKVELNCKKNNKSAPVEVVLEKGDYSAAISTCCCFIPQVVTPEGGDPIYVTPKVLDDLKNNPGKYTDAQAKAINAATPYSAKVILYAKDAAGKDVLVTTPDGAFSTVIEARASYWTNTFNFRHEGGKISAYVDKASINAVGDLEICIVKNLITVSSKTIADQPVANFNEPICLSGFETDIEVLGTNVGEDNAVIIDLDGGLYQLSIEECSIFDADKISVGDSTFIVDEAAYQNAIETQSTSPIAQKIVNEMKPYTGKITWIYSHDGTILERTKIVPDIAKNSGGFADLASAKAAYEGLTFNFKHDGGPVKFFYDDYDIDAAGAVVRMNGSEETATRNSGSVKLKLRCLTEAQFDGCDTPVLEVDLNCGVNTNKQTAVIAALEAGTYVAEVSDCCCSTQSGHIGRVAMTYQSAHKGETKLENPNVGVFDDDVSAKNAYLGNTFSFEHVGGDVAMWALPGELNSTGVISIAIRRRECYDHQTVNSTKTGTGPENNIEDFTSCDMSLDQINFYESGWQSGACCGMHVEVAGAEWIVVKRSIGADTTCGGGESILSDCIAKGSKLGGFHPAIAYPTLDGKTFLGKPTGGYQRFFRDLELEQNILLAVRNLFAGAPSEANEQVFKTVGSPNDNIDTILFPFEM